MSCAACWKKAISTGRALTSQQPRIWWPAPPIIRRESLSYVKTGRFESNSNLVSDFKTGLRDRRPQPGYDGARSSRHFRQSRVDHAGSKAAPACVYGRDLSAVAITQQDWQAVCGANDTQIAGLPAHDSIGLGLRIVKVLAAERHRTIAMHLLQPMWFGRQIRFVAATQCCASDDVVRHRPVGDQNSLTLHRWYPAKNSEAL